MGFKADTSFLRFLSMGAIGVRRTMEQLRSSGFQPIELERYCGSNKIWATKVKRLRLPDLLCVKTGLRVEVKAKSALAIKMSDSTTNLDRRWDAGLRDEDLIAYISILVNDGLQIPVHEAIFFGTKSLRDSIASSRLGQAKSASEGAERDRTWPACVPKQDGTILSVDASRIVAKMKSGRRQPFPLKGGKGAYIKQAYVKTGDTFKANVSIIAGTPVKIANLASFKNNIYDPVPALEAQNALDRYAAVKAIPFRDELRGKAVAALESLLKKEEEPRVALEAAGSAAKLGSSLGEERIVRTVKEASLPFLPMEAVFILTELKNTFAKQQLSQLANDRQLEGDERRQAAIWGLGKAGLKAYDQIVSLIADANENVAMHAIVSFGEDTPEKVIHLLVSELLKGDPRQAPAASEALRLIASDIAVRSLLEAARIPNDWALATLGRLPSAKVRPAIQGTELEAKLAPMLLLSEGSHWLASEDRVLDVAFLAKQNLY